MRNPFGRAVRRLANAPSTPPAGEVSYAEKIRLRERLYSNPVHHGQNGNDVVRRRLESHQPTMVARLGATELRCIRFFLENRTANAPYPAIVKASMGGRDGQEEDDAVLHPVDDRAVG